MHKLENENYPTKRYFHFDYPINISKVKSYVQNRQAIASHSFFPLIYFKKEIEKFTSDKENYTDGRPFYIKERPIKYPGHLDGYIYKYYAEELNNKYNKYTISEKIDVCSIAYRNNKVGYSNINFAAEVISFIHKTENSFIIIGDFSDYFGSLDHNLLKNRTQRILGNIYLPDDWYNVFRSVTKYGYIEKENVENYFGKEKNLRNYGYNKFPKSKKDISQFKKIYQINSNTSKTGIPQGVPISAVLANIYAIDFDKKMNNIANEYGGIYRRYSDDFILVLPNTESKKVSFERVVDLKNNIYNLAEINQLNISEEKTHIYERKNGELIEIFDKNIKKESKLDYLGFVYDGINVTIRQRSIERYYRRMKKYVNKAKQRMRANNRKKYRKTTLKKIPYRNTIYGLFTDKGFKNSGNRKRRTNFIKYVKRSQSIFDEISPETNNLMLEQIKNRKKKIERLLGTRIYVRITDN